MRFAYAGIDFMGEVLDAFVGAGWTPVKLFTRPCDGVLDFNDRVVALARRHKAPIQLSRQRPEDLDGLDCDVLVVAGYPWLVRGWEGRVRYAINFHPSPLPEGRGPYPLFRAILDRWTWWAVTAHRIDPAFDTGPILEQERFALDPAATHESLLARCQMASGRLARRLATDLPRFWDGAKPQGEGSYWPRITDQDRTLDWNQDVETLLRVVRAFGSIETLGEIARKRFYIQEAQGWVEPHGHTPGTVVHSHRRQVTVAVRDGFILVTRWSPVSIGDFRNLGR